MKVAQSCLTVCNPMDYTVHGVLQARILEWIAIPFSRGSSQPGVEHGSSALQVGSLPAEPQGKPKNTGVGNLSLLQRIFQTQESNWALLHCRWILYQLSYQGSPKVRLGKDKHQSLGAPCSGQRVLESVRQSRKRQSSEDRWAQVWIPVPAKFPGEIL